MNRQKSVFRARSQQISKPTDRSPLTEIPDFRRLQATSTSETKRRTADYIIPCNNYDENKKDKFELMNIKVVVYGLTGLVCEEEPKKRQRFGKKDSIFPAAMARRDTKPLGSSTTTNVKYQTELCKAKALDTMTAVVSCQKNGTSNNISFETFLPRLPLGNHSISSLNKVRYAASWPSEQSVLQQDEGSKDRSAFVVTRCMKHTSFIPGIGARSNYCHETIELGINISRGTELIRLGTALVVINGEEEGEVEMNVSTTPFIFDRKKLKKKKNKYGYFSNDSSRRFALDKNAVLKVGVQVIPEEAIRFAKEKEKERMKEENELNELLEQDKLKILLQEMGDDNLVRDRRQIRNLPNDPTITVNGIIPEREFRTNSFFPNMLCGSMPTSWVPNFLKRLETEPDIPKEIISDDNFDQLVIHSLISSISEATEDSDILEDIFAGEL